MFNIFNWLFASNIATKDLGLFVIRVAVGTLFVILHGFPKIMGGNQQWIWLGGQMKNFGITFWPMFWGLAATCAEFFGGICLILGLGTRIAAFFMCIVMLVALRYHFANGDTSKVYEYPLALFFILLGLLISDGGSYSLDYFLK